jgi:hypothetical protein
MKKSRGSTEQIAFSACKAVCDHCRRQLIRRRRWPYAREIASQDDELPARLLHYDHAKAYYGEVREVFEKYDVEGFKPVEQAADAALQIDKLVEDRRCVDWVQNDDVQNRMKTDIEDYLFGLQETQHIPLSLEDIDQILDGCIRIARERRPQ